MTAEQYRTTREYFHQAIDLTPEGRAAVIGSITCPEVREELRRLLALNDVPDTFVDEPLFAVPDTLRPGEVVGRFRITRRIGRGGMGEVFEAEDLKFSSRCAIKTIAPEWIGDSDAATRFERETHVGRMINHPNVCRVYEYLEEQRGPLRLAMIVMELVEGETLGDLVERDGPLEPGSAAPILRGILDGLAAAHDSGVVHRDLKPSNVILQPSGRTVLMDFGLARRTSDDLQTKRLMGTVSWMAPEQHRGESTVRSDIYSLGLLVLYMVTGQQQSTSGQVPRAWRAAIRRATAIVPTERYASVAELRRALFPPRVWTRRACAIGGGAALLGIVGEFRFRDAQFHVIRSAPLVIQAVRNRTSDASLDSVRQVVEAQLEQSPKLRVLDQGASQRRNAMSLAIELNSEREGFRIDFFLASSSTGATRRYAVAAATRADLFPALEEACRWVRATAGESRQEMAELDLRPESATTASWDALLAFTRGEREARDRHAEPALEAFDEALRLDPGFALASMRRGDILAALGRDGEALTAWQQTMRLASERRLSRLEEFRIRSMFAADTWSFADAVSAYDGYTAYYPNDPDAYWFRARPLLLLGRREEALASMVKAVTLDPENAGAQAEAALMGSVCGRTDFSRERLPLALRLNPPVGARNAELIAFIEGRYGELQEWYERALKQPGPEQQSVIRTQHAHLLAELGRWEDSERLLRAGIDSDLAGGLLAEANRKRVSLFALQARLPSWRADAATEQVLAELAASSGPWLLVGAVSLLARSGQTGLARSVAAGLRVSFPAPLFRYAVDRASGEIHVAEGRITEGLAQLRKAADALPPEWPREFLAWGLAKAGSRSAVGEFERVVAAKGILWVNTFLERPGIWGDSLAQVARQNPFYADALQRLRGRH